MTESSSIDWQDYHHSELTVQQLYAILALRSEVFVVEQTCAYQDIDGQDLTGENRHIVAWLDGKPAAYARILRHEDGVAIGRVIVAPSARGLKLGYQLMERALVSCQKNWPDIRVAISCSTPCVDADYYNPLSILPLFPSFRLHPADHLRTHNPA